MNPFSYVRRHARAFLFTAVVLALSGVALMLGMPISLFPDVTFPRIVVLANNGEAPPDRMMAEVTRPLEETASAVPGVRTVRSITSRGATEISIGLDWSVNVFTTLQFLQGRIANIRNELPPGASVMAEQMTVSVFPIHGYSLTSDSLTQVELRDIALYQIRPALLRVKGVARVEVVGGDTREFLVSVSPEKLASYHLSITDVADAIQQTNVVAASGLVENNHQLYLALVSGLLRGAEDIGRVPVASPGGIPVTVADVATVRPSVADKYIRTTAHGRDAVLITVLKQPTGSTVQIRNDITREFNALRLPSGVRFENWYDQGDFITKSILSTRDSIIIGIVLAMLVVLLFLRSWRVSLVILLVVPATLASTFAFLSAFGLTINIMTLGGVAAAVGLIIDDAIVVIEYVFTHLHRHVASGEQGRSLFADTAVAALHDLMPAIVGSTASTIVIHVPLAFLGGITGAFFSSLSITMVVAMLISFALSVTLAPLLGSRLIRKEDIDRELAHQRRAARFAVWHERILRRMLGARWFILPVALLFGAIGWVLYERIGSDFMPEMDEGAFVLDYWSPPGTSLAETDRILRDVERILMATPEVEAYSRRTGTELGFFLTEPNQGDFLVKLRENRSRDIASITDEVRARVESAQPSVRVEFVQLMMDVIGDMSNNPEPIEIKLFGDDPGVLRRTAAVVADRITTISGVVDVFDGTVIAGPSLIAHVDPLQSARLGLSPEDVRAQLSTVMQGRVDSRILRGEKMIGIRVRFPDAYRADLHAIETFQLRARSGALVPLAAVATLERTAGQAELMREGLRPMVAVTARITGRDLGSTVHDVQQLLRKEVYIPPGITVEFGGVYQTQQESFRGLLVVAVSAMLLVMIVLLFEFGEFAAPFAILVINLISLAGVFAALWLTGMTFNISSFVGIIMIIGIVAENGIFVLHEVNAHRRQGMGLDDALVHASRLRARPIVMTTLAAVSALAPLSLGIGAGAQLQRPLAIAVIGGFSLSSLLLIFGLPLVYRVFHRSHDAA